MFGVGSKGKTGGGGAIVSVMTLLACFFYIFFVWLETLLLMLFSGKMKISVGLKMLL